MQINFMINRQINTAVGLSFPEGLCQLGKPPTLNTGNRAESLEPVVLSGEDLGLCSCQERTCWGWQVQCDELKSKQVPGKETRKGTSKLSRRKLLARKLDSDTSKSSLMGPDLAQVLDPQGSHMHHGSSHVRGDADRLSSRTRVHKKPRTHGLCKTNKQKTECLLCSCNWKWSLTR